MAASKTTSVRMVIPSEIRLIDLVHGASEQMAQLAGISEDESLNVGMAVREAVINAIKHGNGMDPALEVDIELRANGSGMSAIICDNGEGFDPDATADPTDPENLLATSGRGLLMIRAFVDEVKFTRRDSRGMRVVLTKHAPAEAPDQDQ